MGSSSSELSNLLIPSHIADEDKKYSLSSLLPYDIQTKSHSKLSDGLKEYLLLLIAAKKTMVKYQQGNLSYFDSLVGENSCQIRATLLSLIDKHCPIDITESLSKIAQLIKQIECYKENLTCQKTMMMLGEFISYQKLDLQLSYKELFLISSYILTKVRVILPPDPSKRIARNESTKTKKS